VNRKMMELLFQYRCRRCGSLDEVRRDSSYLITDDGVDTPIVQSPRWHQCIDGGTGVAEFIGFRPAGEAG